ncbi:MAG: prepilin-type N-terminal cleavage/methylation domain-containing protein [Elusimicrobiaceae bacterium]|nr:prepilin-type N-terminal cleavage/methylation domain-containing protein [Elusimicrobiaceae bacterium]
MKKGFTLIELLIVMVIVGILVTVTLPKYTSSLERGRVLEAMTNLEAASDVANRKFIENNYVYTRTGVTDGNGKFLMGDFAHSRYFGTPTWPASGVANLEARISVTRDGGEYTLTAFNRKGELKYVICTPTDPTNVKICENIGADLDTTDGLYKLAMVTYQ